ncbi:Colicin V production protein [Lachnospiraceae bacterium]|nr:Colicin V production protein [Lachnospiraceae bacterium]
MTAELLLMIIVIVIGLFTFYGYSQGFLRVVFSFVSILLAIWLVTRISPLISDFIMNRTPLHEMISGRIFDLLADLNSVRDNTIYENQITTIRSYSFPELLKSTLIDNNNPSVYAELLVTAFEDYVARFLSKLLIRILVYLSTLLLVYVILKMTMFSLDIIGKIPILHGLNNMAGALIGMGEGFVVVWLFFLFMTLFAGSTAGHTFFNMVNENRVLTLFYNTNVFFEMISGTV